MPIFLANFILVTLGELISMTEKIWGQIILVMISEDPTPLLKKYLRSRPRIEKKKVCAKRLDTFFQLSSDDNMKDL